MAPRGVFEDVKLEWDGKEYTIPSDGMMGAIHRVEEHVTLKELLTWVNSPGGARFGKIAEAYASVLAYAGAKSVKAEDIYVGLLNRGEAEKSLLFASIAGLLKLMLPPEPMLSTDGAESTSKN